MRVQPQRCNAVQEVKFKQGHDPSSHTGPRRKEKTKHIYRSENLPVLPSREQVHLHPGKQWRCPQSRTTPPNEENPFPMMLNDPMTTTARVSINHLCNSPLEKKIRTAGPAQLPLNEKKNPELIHKKHEGWGGHQAMPGHLTINPSAHFP